MIKLQSNSTLYDVLQYIKEHIDAQDYDPAANNLRKIGEHMAMRIIIGAGLWKEACTNKDGTVYNTPKFSNCLYYIRTKNLVDRKTRNNVFEKLQEYGNRGSHTISQVEQYQIVFTYEETKRYIENEFSKKFPDAMRIGELPYPKETGSETLDKSNGTSPKDPIQNIVHEKDDFKKPVQDKANDRLGTNRVNTNSAVNTKKTTPSESETFNSHGNANNTVSNTYSINRKPGPNDPCSCGSGLKYKLCHGKKIEDGSTKPLNDSKNRNSETNDFQNNNSRPKCKVGKDCIYLENEKKVKICLVYKYFMTNYKSYGLTTDFWHALQNKPYDPVWAYVHQDNNCIMSILTSKEIYEFKDEISLIRGVSHLFYSDTLKVNLGIIFSWWEKSIDNHAYITDIFAAKQAGNGKYSAHWAMFDDKKQMLRLLTKEEVENYGLTV